MRAKLALVTTALALLTCGGRATAPRIERRVVDESTAAAEARTYATAIAANLPRVPDPPIVHALARPLDNAALRRGLVAFARAIGEGRPAVCDFAVRTERAVVWLYRDGARVGRGEGRSEDLCVALKDATRRAIAAAGGSAEGARMLIDLPALGQSIVEYDGGGLELAHGLVPARTLDRALVNARLDDGARFLARAMDGKRHGVHKLYHPSTDTRERELHTVYTASTALTFLKLFARDKDPRHLEHARDALGFVLTMQNRAPDDRARGGFFYSFDLERERHDETVVVGTAAKAIFALLELHAVDKDRRYLDAAVLAADFLVSMQRPDGSMAASLQRAPGAGHWSVSKKESLLYAGQTLSALSRVYRVTKQPRYLDAAARIAVHLRGKVTEHGCHLGDDYRKPNPISSSWVVMSLLDFVRATKDQQMERVVMGCADALVARQLSDADDVELAGRYGGAMSSSGNGWVAEVISEVDLYCRARALERCDRFRDSVVAATRLLAQYTYTRENAFVAKNPDAALGGLFWSVRDRYVRTDAVCHAMNAYLNILDRLGDGPLVAIPERPVSGR